MLKWINIDNTQPHKLVILTLMDYLVLSTMAHGCLSLPYFNQGNILMKGIILLQLVWLHNVVHIVILPMWFPYSMASICLLKEALHIYHSLDVLNIYNSVLQNLQSLSKYLF